MVALALVADIRLCCTGLPGINVLAYLRALSVTKRKKLYNIDNWSIINICFVNEK
jgi:hypothetical protein